MCLILSLKVARPHPTQQVHACPGLVLISLIILESGSLYSSVLSLKQSMGNYELCWWVRNMPPSIWTQEHYSSEPLPTVIHEQKLTACFGDEIWTGQLESVTGNLLEKHCCLWKQRLKDKIVHRSEVGTIWCICVKKKNCPILWCALYANTEIWVIKSYTVQKLSHKKMALK